jgi:hypothetical protein
MLAALMGGQSLTAHRAYGPRHRRDRSGIRGERIVWTVCRGGHACRHHQESQRRRAKVVSDPEFQKRYLERFAVQPVPGPLDVFAEYLRKESAKWGEVIKAANVKIE